MTLEAKMNVLKLHSVPYKMVNERLIVDSMIAYTKPFECVEDATNWTKKELYDWLGY